MKIGILGSGNMGRAIGTRWAMNGHDVFFGGRDVNKTRAVAESVGHNTQYGALAEAAAFGDVLLHTIRDVLPSELGADADSLAGKVLIDLNNNAIPEGFKYEAVTQSFSERFQADMPQLKVVKAFNMFAMELFEHDAKTIANHDVSVFLASDDSQAKSTVATLAAELGFTPVDSGDIRQARLIESMADFIRMLMIDKGMGPLATISAHALPNKGKIDLGGRQASNFK